MTMRWLILLMFLLAAGCSDEHVQSMDFDIAATPRSVDFGAVFIGETAEREVELRNHSPVAAELELAVDEHFHVEPTRLKLAPGEQRRVVVVFQPREAGELVATLRPSDLEKTIALRGIGAERSVEAPALVDFGETLVGNRRTRAIEVTNQSAAAQLVQPLIEGEDAGSFDAPPPLLLQPGEGRLVAIGFTPAFDRHHTARLRLRLCESCADPIVELVGNGLVEGIAVRPTAVDFGRVAIGATTSQDVRLANESRSAATILAATLVAPAESPFSAVLPSGGSVLPGRGSRQIPITFSPSVPGEFAALLRFQVGSQVAEIPVTGVAVNDALQADPSLLDFGSTAANVRVERGVRILARTGTPTLTGLSIEGDGFTLVDTPLLPMRLDAAGIDLQIGFRSPTPGLHHAELVVATDVPGADLRVPLRAAVVSETPCLLAVDPPEVNFGITAVDARSTRLVEVRNAGSSRCDVWRIGLTGDDGFRLPSAPSELLALLPGSSTTIEVEYAPTSSGLGMDRGALEIESSPPGSPPIVVPLSGLALDFPPEAHPAMLDFGPRPMGSRTLRSTSVLNGRVAAVEVVRIELRGDAAFAVRMPSALPRPLAAGASEAIAVEFAPTSVGEQRAELAIWFRDVPAPRFVPLAGEGLDAPCGSGCSEPQVTCPAPRTVYVHATTGLEGAASAPAGLDGCVWAVRSAPADSTAAPIALGDCAAQLRPDQMGDWVLTMTARDGAGREASCDVGLHVLPQPTLLVELTWDAPDDVDLHLLHPDAGPPADPATWFSTPGDCFFANGAPDWDGPGRSDDPILERDDRVGRGPEIIRIDQPRVGQPYRVGAHWFDATHGNVGLTATTRVYCGGALAAEVTMQLEAMHHAVVVGELTFGDTSDCSFVPDGTTLWLMP